MAMYHEGLCFPALQKTLAKFFLVKDMPPVDRNVFFHRLKKKDLKFALNLL